MTDLILELHPFIRYLVSLAERDDRGGLAALRRGLGQPPGTVAETYRYVIPWLPQNPSRTQERAYYLIASLFAYHPKYTPYGNMGTHLAQTRSPERDEDALERRFTALLAAHPEDMSVYLRQAVSYLKSKDEIPVNWSQLLKDLQWWAHPDRFVQKRWANAFWRRSNPPAN